MLYLYKLISEKFKSTREADIFEDACENSFAFEDAKPTPFESKKTTKELQPVSEEIEAFRDECPDYFVANERNVLGLVIDVKPQELLVDIECKKIKVNLTRIETEYAYEVGDRVYVRCNVESEESFIDGFKETFEPLGLKPAIKKKNQKCIIKEIHSDGIVLNNNCYMTKLTWNEGAGNENFQQNDEIYVDMIECKKDNFKWRCISFSIKILSKNGLKAQPKNHQRSLTTKDDDKKLQLSVPTQAGRWYNYQAKLLEYADQVWSQEVGEIVPGGGTNSNRRFRAVRLPHAVVPQNIKEIYFKNQGNTRKCRHDMELAYACLKEELCFENYFHRFQILVWLEEIELFKCMRTYDCDQAQFTKEGEFLAMTIQDLAERRPSLSVGDKIRVYTKTSIGATNVTNDNINNDEISLVENSKNSLCFEGVLRGILCDRVLLKFNPIFQDTYDGGAYRAEFYYSRTGLRQRHYALEHAVKRLGKDFLFPTKLHYRERPQADIRWDKRTSTMHNLDSEIKWHNSQLNELQKFAIYNILRGEVKQMPYIIYGPPGTGKTITLVETILQLVSNLPKAHLLVSAPSNSAANLICSRLIESKGVHMGEMVRLVSYNIIERDQIPEDLLPYCATIDPGEDGTYEEEGLVTKEGIQMNCSMRSLARYRITIGTCASLGKYLEVGFNSEHFTHVLVDEASQCTEPQVMVAVSQVAKTNGQVILAGDPMQLTAIVINKYAANCGLSMSFLERLLKLPPYRKDVIGYSEYSGFNPVLVTKLLYNYRSLPSIVRVYNYLFYDFELKPTIDEDNSPEAQLLQKTEKSVLFKSTKRPKSHGVYFYAVRGENMRERDSPSWCNPREANVVFHMALSLYRCGLKPEDLGIITPYAKQVKCIKNLFTKAKIKAPKIASVEEFQGQERNVILLSTVRTARREVVNYDWRYSLGFVKFERRFNVAISRARALLIVFGDPELLMTDQCWGIYVQDCRSNDTFYGTLDDDDDENEPKDDGLQSVNA